MTEVDTAAVTSADGTTIGYRSFGAGPPLLVLHGAMQSALSQRDLAGALADRFTVVLPDRRGRGASGPFGADWSLHREVEDVAALVAGDRRAARVRGQLGRGHPAGGGADRRVRPAGAVRAGAGGGRLGADRLGRRGRRAAGPRRRGGGAGDRHARGPDGPGVHPEAAPAAARADDRGHDGPHRRRPAELPRSSPRPSRTTGGSWPRGPSPSTGTRRSPRPRCCSAAAGARRT